MGDDASDTARERFLSDVRRLVELRRRMAVLLAARPADQWPGFAAMLEAFLPDDAAERAEVARFVGLHRLTLWAVRTGDLVASDADPRGVVALAQCIPLDAPQCLALVQRDLERALREDGVAPDSEVVARRLAPLRAQWDHVERQLADADRPPPE